jgi:hypothetical protein
LSALVFCVFFHSVFFFYFIIVCLGNILLQIDRVLANRLRTSLLFLLNEAYYMSKLS